MGERIVHMGSAEVERILRCYGFQLISQQGSHRKWRHPQRRLQVIVPEHAGRDLPVGTLRSIFVNAEIPECEWNVDMSDTGEILAPGVYANDFSDNGGRTYASVGASDEQLMVLHDHPAKIA